MGYFKNQKEEQKDVVNVLIPYSIETIIELHDIALETLKQAKMKQDEVNELNNFINTSPFEGLKSKARAEICTLLEEKSELLKSHEDLITKIAKQNGSI